MDIKYGGFWVRFAASLIDSLWVTVLTYGPIIFVAVNDLMDPDETAYLVFYTFCMFVLPGIVSVILWSLFQSTPGKLAVGLVVVDATTLRPASVLKYS
ncbi:MAG: RDD family protein, partial [Pseudomonadota bacterium]